MSSATPLNQGWFSVSTPSPGVYAILEPLHFELVLSYLVVGADRAVLVDSGMGVGDIGRLTSDLTDRPISLINSHSHWDHIGGNRYFTDISIHRSEAGWLRAGVDPLELLDAFAPDQLLGPLPAGIAPESITIPGSEPTRLLDGGERFDLGERVLEVIHTPGHSPGLICLLDEANGVLFSTDAAYPGPLYSYAEETDFLLYQKSIQQLAELASNVRFVHPSHYADNMPVSMLVDVDRAFDEIAAGRQPDQSNETYATHQFDNFAVRVAPRFRGR